HVLVLNDEADRRAERLPLEHTRQNPYRIRFLPLGNQSALPRCAAVEIRLDVGFGQGQPRGTAIDDGTGGATVRLAPGRHAEEASPGVAHASRIRAAKLELKVRTAPSRRPTPRWAPRVRRSAGR